MPFFQKILSDNVLIEGILSKDGSLRSFENRLYEKYAYLIREGVWKHKLSTDECSIAYSDTILTIIENIQNGRFEGRSGLKTYLYQIFNNKCVDLIRKNATNRQQVHKGSTLDDYISILPDDTRSIVQQLIDQYDLEVLHERLRELGEKCRQMLKAWSEGFMDQEIAVEMDYQSAAVVKTSRLRCMEKLREMYLKGIKKDSGRK
ncbi:RNA polymerase sigma factor [Dyadobacter subterraneus]|uniref:Sigma-70 family RNA polymerase sigma factor n=1 Tax=Dyadobacter subterraneus TaxID=2773304 RepID=A0ABR9WJQ2_9BACT|nr:sigma-70 family RNA polymerase sigma factor [Dyadobacter subterraneus]MBE9465731.1 sigma-70 family RNA polymerase sigma factor [Dyadobacter subterraneus]